MVLSSTSAEAHALSELLKAILTFMYMCLECGLWRKPAWVGMDNLAAVKNAHTAVIKKEAERV